LYYELGEEMCSTEKMKKVCFIDGGVGREHEGAGRIS